jgi:hypothetical protein
MYRRCYVQRIVLSGQFAAHRWYNRASQPDHDEKAGCRQQGHWSNCNTTI